MNGLNAWRATGWMAVIVALGSAGCAVGLHDVDVDSSLAGIGDDPGTIGKGALQAEVAYAGERGGGASEVLLRWGLTERSEVHLGLDEVVLRRSATAPTAMVGGKLRVFETQGGVLPDVALQAGVFRSLSRRESGLAAAGTLAAEWELPASFDLAFSATYLLDEVSVATGVAGLGLPLPGRFHGGLEFGLSRGENGSTLRRDVAASFGRPIAPGLVLDGWTGVSSFAGHREVFFGMGLARQW